jgi:hypothetical protein
MNFRVAFMYTPDLTGSTVKRVLGKRRVECPGRVAGVSWQNKGRIHFRGQAQNTLMGRVRAVREKRGIQVKCLDFYLSN